MNKASSRTLSDSDIQDALSYFSKSILQDESWEEVAWDIADNVIAKLRFDDCVIYYLDHEKKVLIQVAAHGPKNPVGRHIVDPIEIELGTGITGYAALTGESITVVNTIEHPLYIKDDQVRLSEVAVPIKIENEVVGVIDCEHSSEDYFSDEHLKILEAIASIASIKLSRLQG